MKIGGWILFGLGVAFLLLAALAKLGGGDMPASAFIVAALLSLGGLRMASAAKGTLPPAAANLPAPGGGAGPGAPAPAAASPTVEIPMTPVAAACIAAARRRTGRVTAIVAALGLLFFAGLGAVLDAAMVSTPGAFKVLPMMTGMGVLLGAFLGAIWYVQNGLPMGRDLRSVTYLRTSGPIQLLRMYGGFALRLADRSFITKGRTAVKELRGVGWAVVDYSPHGHVILGAWDHGGRQVYAAPGYVVAPPKTAQG